MKFFRVNYLPLAMVLVLHGWLRAQPVAPADTTKKDSAQAAAPAAPAPEAAAPAPETPAPAPAEAAKVKVDATEKVIVVGYGTMKKRDVTGSVAIIGADDIKKSGAISVDKALQGKAAGVNVTSNSGQPGKGVTVRIRGVGSTNNSDPLYVVDGVPTSNIDYLNPLDIETITVLKDASSTSIYGSRAANGVVLITTKSGVVGKTEVRVNATYGVSSMPKKLDFVTAAQFAQLRQEAFTNAGLVDSADATVLADAIAGKYGKGTDWVGEVTRDAIRKTLDFSISHGTKNLTYFMSGGIQSDEGVVGLSDSKRTTVRADIISHVKSWLTVGQNLGFANTQTHQTDESEEWNSTLSTAIQYDPITPAHDANGKLVPKAIGTGSGIKNPIGVMERANDFLEADRLTGSAYAEIKFMDNLSLKSTYGLDVRHADSTVFNPSYEIQAGDANAVNSLIRRNNMDFNWTWDNVLNYGLNIGEDGFLKFLVGSTMAEDNSEFFQASNSKMPSNDPSQRYLGAATGTPSATGSAAASSLVSGFARVNYDYAYKYFLNGAVRADGSSKFGPNNRWGYFPSVGAGWDASKESFLKSATWLDLLKLRLGWGIIGNANIGNYLYTTTTKPNQNYVINGEVVKGAAFASAGNPDIKWEGQESYNVGLDFQLFGKAVDFTSDFYLKKTNDMLLAATVPTQSGLQIPMTVNAGDVENKGVDLSLSYEKEMGALWTKVTGIYSMYRNEVTKMENPIPGVPFRSTGYVNLTEKGHPMAMFYGQITDGLDSLGDIKYVQKDSGGDSLGFIGNPHPDFTYSLSWDVGYKTKGGDFDFNVLFQGSQGNDIYNGTRYYTDNPTGTFKMDKRMLDACGHNGAPCNDAQLPRMNFNAVNPISDRYVEDGSYLRLKSLTLGYTLPPALTAHVGVGSLRIYAGATNLWTLTGYKGLDPEVGLGRFSTRTDNAEGVGGGGTLDLGIDRANYPQPRTYYTGIDISI